MSDRFVKEVEKSKKKLEAKASLTLTYEKGVGFSFSVVGRHDIASGLAAMAAPILTCSINESGEWGDAMEATQEHQDQFLSHMRQATTTDGLEIDEAIKQVSRGYFAALLDDDDAPSEPMQ